MIQIDKQVVFEHSGTDFKSSGKFCIKRGLGHCCFDFARNI